MDIINFDNIVENEQVKTFKTVKKGAQQLTITNVEEGSSASGVPFFDVTFNSAKDEADFKHKFYASEKALPKLKSLMEGFTGAKPVGSLTSDSIIAALVGQTAYCLVDANIVSKQVGDKVYNNEYATFLRFRDFANKTTPYKDEDARTEDRSAPKEATNSILDDAAKGEDDLPF